MVIPHGELNRLGDEPHCPVMPSSNWVLRGRWENGCVGVWCLVFGVWCLVFGVWCLVFGVVCMDQINSNRTNPASNLFAVHRRVVDG